MSYVILIYSLLLLQDGGFQKMLVFDRTSFSPSYSSILQLVHRCYPFHWYQCISSVDPCLRVLWMSTHGCFASPFSPSFFFLVIATRWWSPGSKRHLRRWLLLHRGCLLLRGGHRRPGVVRRLPGRRPCLFDCCCFCASLLKANLFNLCLYSDIVASADSFVFKLMYSTFWGPLLVI